MKYSIALSCGTALGFSHIGVLKFLDDNNIKIKEISGCSIGSWIGSLYAIGYCGKEIENIALSVIKRGLWKLSDIHISFKGILKGQKIYKFINESVNNINIEDTKVPIKIITTNSLNGKMKVLTKGPLANAIRASISVPIIFKPWKINNIPYIDGGVGYPINCDILSDDVPKIASIAIGKPSIYKKFPNIIDQIFRNQTQLNIKLSELNCKNADIIIQPKYNDIYQWSFKDIQKIIDIGYNEAQKKIL